MRRVLTVIGGLCLLHTLGCSMCASPYDDHYAAFGGRIQRSDRVAGRVGSILDPAADALTTAQGESMLVPGVADEQTDSRWPADEPEPAELEPATPNVPEPAGPPESGTSPSPLPLPDLTEPDGQSIPSLPEIESDEKPL